MNKPISIEDQFAEKITEIIKANLQNEQFGVNELAKEISMSRATLHRKVKAVTGKTVSKFISEIRLEEARKLLKARVGTVSEISYMVGFGSPTYFIKRFHEHYGYSPGELLKASQLLPQTMVEREPKRSFLSAKFVVSGILLIFLLVFGKIFLTHSGENEVREKKILTTSTTALNLYQQGLNLMDVYVGSRKEEHFLEAKIMFEKAVQLDSTFGDAYAHIADIYLSSIPFSPKTNKGFNYADSGKVYIDLAEKYGVVDTDYLLRKKSVYCQRTADFDEALRLFEDCWKGKKKDYNYYHERGNQAFHARNYYETVKYLMKYLELKPDSVLPFYDRLQKLSIVLAFSGFREEAQEFAYRQYQLNNDKIGYWNRYPQTTFDCGNFSEAIKTYETAYNNNNVSWTVYMKLLEIYMLTGQQEKGLKLLPEFDNYITEKYNKKMPNYLLGYFHSIKGENDLANWHFEASIKQLEEYCERSKFQQSKPNYLTIAACYSMLNDKAGVIKSLEKLIEKTSIPYLVVLQLQISPMFENMRNDSDFEKIKSQIEQKYYNEKEKIKQVLNENLITFTYNLEGSAIATPF